MDNQGKFRVLIIGSGAIGIYIGGSLVNSGHEVVFLERPATANILRESGLSLFLGETRIHIATPHIETDIQAVIETQRFDFVVYALKSFDTKSFLDEIKGIENAFPPILCLSNGVDNEQLLIRKFGEDKVIHGTVTSAIGKNSPESIKLEKLRGIGISNLHPLSTSINMVFNHANLNSRLYNHPHGMKWSKMLTNLLGNASSAILNIPPGEVYGSLDLYKIEAQQINEALAIMDKLDYPVMDLPGTPVRLLAFVIKFLPSRIAQPILSKAIGTGRGKKMPSFHIDLYSNRGRSEVKYLNGAVSRLGDDVGIETPVNRILTNTLLDLTDKKIPLSTYDHQINDFLSLFKEWT